MYNRADGSRKGQPYFNCENNKQGGRPVAQESREKNKRTTVCQVMDNREFFPKMSNPPYASCSSTAVRQCAIKSKRSINKPTPTNVNKEPTKDFDTLIALYQFTEMEKKSKQFGQDYDGREHSLYGLLIKEFFYAKRHFNTDQMNKLLLSIKTHDPKPWWNWRSLTTTFSSWAVAGLFTPNNGLCPEAKRIQTDLFKACIDQIFSRSNKKAFTPDITYISVHSLLSSMTKLPIKKQLESAMLPKIKSIIIITCHHVGIMAEKKEKFGFSHHQIASLLDVMNSIEVQNLCKSRTLKNTQDLNDTVITLLTLMEAKIKSQVDKNHFSPKQVSDMLRAIARMKNNKLLTDTTTLNDSVVVLCPLIAQLKDQLSVQDIKNILWAMTELGSVGQLNPKNREKLKDTALTLLPRVKTKAELREEEDPFYPQDIARVLYFVIMMMDLKLLVPVETTGSLNALVAVLLPLVIEQANNNMTTKCLSSLLCGLVRLEGLGLNEKNTLLLEDTLDSLLPCAEIKLESEEIDLFNPEGLSILLRTIAKRVNSTQKLSTQMLNKFVNLLLPLIAEQKDSFPTPSLVSVVWSMAKLSNMVNRYLSKGNAQKLEEVVVILLPLVESKVTSREEKDYLFSHTLASLVWAIAKLTDSMLKLTPQMIKNLVTTLFLHVEEQKAKFTPRSIASLLWAVSALGDLIEIQRAVTLSVFLINVIKTYAMPSQQERMMSIWGLLVCSARLCLSGSVDESGILQHYIKQLFSSLKHDVFETKHDKITMLMASTWLGEDLLFDCYDYEIIKSQTQRDTYKALSKKFPSLEIVEERSLHGLPPADFYLPEHRIVIEVQGPHHYLGGDFKTKNGSTFLKLALFAKLGYDVIEIPVPPGYESGSLLKAIYKIQQKIHGADAVDDRSLFPISNRVQESSDEEYFTANEDSDAYFSATDCQSETKTKIKTKKQTDAWQVVVVKHRKKSKKKRL